MCFNFFVFASSCIVSSPVLAHSRVYILRPLVNPSTRLLYEICSYYLYIHICTFGVDCVCPHHHIAPYRVYCNNIKWNQVHAILRSMKHLTYCETTTTTTTAARNTFARKHPSHPTPPKKHIQSNGFKKYAPHSANMKFERWENSNDIHTHANFVSLSSSVLARISAQCPQQRVCIKCAL